MKERYKNDRTFSTVVLFGVRLADAIDKEEERQEEECQISGGDGNYKNEI
jgi:hypothetical protein